MQRASLVLVAVAFMAAGFGFYWIKKHPAPQGGPGTGANAGAGAGTGVGQVSGTGGGEGTVAQEQVLPAEKARAASPLLEAHSSWPRLDALPAFPAEPSAELKQAAFEVDQDVAQWFSKDLRFSKFVDGPQVYVKGVNASGSVTVLVARNRVKDVYTLGFEAIFADAGKVDAETTVKRLKVVLGPELMVEVEKRGIKPSPAVTGDEDMAGVVMLGESGPGTVFPYLYLYAKPKQVVGILQTIAMKKVK